MPQKVTVCILYGFCEGPRLAKRFREALEAEDFAIVHDPARADILVGHSGGCYMVPEQTTAKRIVQIGIPYWPGRSVIDSGWRKLITDLSHHHREGELRFWLHKTLWNVTYFWKIPRNIRMLRARNRGTIWRWGKQTTVIRPTFDTFCTDDLESLPFAEKPRLVTIPGHHDQCWRAPKPYIAELLRERGRL